MYRLINPIREEKEYKGLLTEVIAQSKSKHPLPAVMTGLSDGGKCAFFIALSLDYKAKRGGKTLIIVPDESSGFLASKVFTECGLKTAVYPFRDFTFSDLASSHSYEHERLSVLDKIRSGGADIYITTPDAALQFTMPRQKFTELTLSLGTGDSFPIETLIEKLCDLGYSRADMVEGPGQFSVRGGIVDLFPPEYDKPLRIEYFGDEIDRIGYFDVISQRTEEMADRIVLLPGREIVYGDREKNLLLDLIGKQLKKAANDTVRQHLADERAALADTGILSVPDKYITAVYPQRECFLDYFDSDTLLIVSEFSNVSDRLKSYDFQNSEITEKLISSGEIGGAYAEFGRDAGYFLDFIYNHACVYCNMFTSSYERVSGLFSIRCRQNVSLKDNLALLKDDLSVFVAGKYRINILTENSNVSRKICDELLNDSITCTVSAENSEPGIPNFISGINMPGFELTQSKYVCLSMYASVFSAGKVISTARKPKKRKKDEKKIFSEAELQIGDYVVHENHGIGRYCGMSTVTMAGVTSEYLKIEYAGDGKLYLPATQLDRISKYTGAGAEAGLVKLSKLGGTDWVKAKTKAKAAAKEMAKELINLYAERMRREGIAFEPDDAMQREFESSFEFEETEGQLNASSEIKADMESSVPMDRLLCGDVGYGKTEVALRAAFKAARSGYQVAILVPTTILALQHYQTICSRMRGFPVTVDMISRFRKPSEQKESLKKLKRGETDIIVGTHRLISSDVQFRKLGLVIVDEEQRFGVAQKEKLKKLVKDVDVLTLTATPIPRTLNMAMSGIRDMSVLEEPPVDRIPVQTFVLEYDKAIIFEAIKKELRRGGQVFYLHNRIENLSEIASDISLAVPDANIAVAHGQMDKEELSDIWKDMLAGNIDILVCTTLIEAGVDIPNANTLIIDDAERYGLAQLHQIRGRVGRSGRRAYAYLTYRKGSVLKEVAEKRLAAIRDFTEFGSGFRVAMRDMEIRGAGNLLGSEQHGQMESVGYELYMKLLSEAVLEEKGEPVKQETECKVNLNIDAYIPEKYIRSTSQRIDAYKKIASVRNEEDFSDVTDELCDRYGNLPIQAVTLLKISLIRALAGNTGIEKVEKRENSALFFTHEFQPDVIREMQSCYKGRFFISAGNTPYFTVKLSETPSFVDEICQILKKYTQLKSEIR